MLFMVVNKQTSRKTQGSNTNIWSSILRGVASSKMIPTKNILLLGDPSSGKASIIQHLQNKVAAQQTIIEEQQLKTQQQQLQITHDDNTKHLALGYTYTNICDDDNEETARLGIYQLSTPDHSALLKSVLDMEMIAATMILIVLDWSQPWSFVARLQQWMQVVDQAILNLCYQDPANKAAFEGMRQQELDYMRHYADTESTTPRTNGISADQVTLPLPEGALSINYGIPIAVVCCKSDEQTRLEKTANYGEDLFDYVQQVLRTICMKYGAALFYTSTLYPQSYWHLRQYILHRTISAKHSTTGNRISSPSSFFQEKAQVMDRDTVMVPSGWDSWGKIKALQRDFDCQQICERWDIDMGRLEDRQPMADQGLRVSFEQMIVDPEANYKSVVVPSVTVCENEQDVLKRHFDSLQRDGGQASANTPTTTSTTSDILHHQPSLIGPLDTSMTNALGIIYGTDSSTLSTGSTNSNKHYSKDIDTSIKKLAWDKLNKGTTVPLTSSTSDTRTSPGNTILSASASENVSNSSSTDIANGTSNEVLTNFFQSLLSKKATSLTPSISSSSSSSSSPSVANFTRTDASTTAKATRGSGLVN